MTDVAALLTAEMESHAQVLAATRDVVAQPFARLVGLCADSLASGGKLLFFGNGGSAADAQHLAAELVVRYRVNRRPLAALALTTDTSILTACSNDFSYEDIFARQIEALARPGDVAIGISTSGQSPNVIKALKAARAMGVVTAGFSGRDGGAMHHVCDALVVIPSDITARIQEMHILLGHVLCDALEQGVVTTAQRLDEAEVIKAFDAHAGDEAFPEAVAERLIGGENAVKVFREYRALTLRDLATKSGLGASYLSDIENGKRKGTVETMKAIAEALGVDLDDLV